MILTLEQLEKMDACQPARDLFKKIFGKEANLSEVVIELNKRNLEEYEAWLLAQNYKLTEGLVEAGANIHANDDDALCLAVRDGRLDIAELLLDKGANVHASNNYAFCWAIRYGRPDMVELLSEAMRYYR